MATDFKEELAWQSVLKFMESTHNRLEALETEYLALERLLKKKLGITEDELRESRREVVEDQQSLLDSTPLGRQIKAHIEQGQDGLRRLAEFLRAGESDSGPGSATLN